jgi:hypothetical protein
MRTLDWCRTRGLLRKGTCPCPGPTRAPQTVLSAYQPPLMSLKALLAGYNHQCPSSSLALTSIHFPIDPRYQRSSLPSIYKSLGVSRLDVATESDRKDFLQNKAFGLSVPSEVFPRHTRPPSQLDRQENTAGLHKLLGTNQHGIPSLRPVCVSTIASSTSILGWARDFLPSYCSSTPSATMAAAETLQTERSCWICLSNDTETPGAGWANPCPCSLEAHEDCILRWVAETESNNRQSKDKLRCPACKALIRVDEPHDAFVALRDRLHREYSRFSPIALGVILATGSWVGSVWYGYKSISLLVGNEPPPTWVLRCSMFSSADTVPTSEQILADVLLSSVGPNLVLSRSIPYWWRFIAMPVSFMVCVRLYSPFGNTTSYVVM